MKSVEFKNLTKFEYTRNEQFNSLSINIKFSGDIKVLGITSCNENAGKSFVSVNLARKYAEDGMRVVMIDADLRKSRIIRDYNVQGVDEIKGLSHYLSGQAQMDDVIYGTNVENLNFIFAGHVVPNPTVLIDTERFDRLLAYLREKYDIVIIDTPPILPIIDTAVIAPKCDGVLMVVSFGNDRRHSLVEAKKQLEVTNARILGTILNQVPASGSRYVYYKGRGYGRYGKGYGNYGKGYGNYGKQYGYGRQYGYGQPYGDTAAEEQKK